MAHILSEESFMYTILSFRLHANVFLFSYISCKIVQDSNHHIVHSVPSSFLSYEFLLQQKHPQPLV